MTGSRWMAAAALLACLPVQQAPAHHSYTMFDMEKVVDTIEDPKTFSRPWDAKVIYKTAKQGTGLIEFICENNRNARE